MHKKTIQPVHIFGSDPFIRILHFKPLSLAMLTLAVGVLYQFGLSGIYGSLYPAGGVIHSASADYFNMVNFIFIIPSVAYYYLLQPLRIANVYRSVSIHLYNKTSSVEIDFSKWHQNPLPWVSGLLLAAITVWLGIADNLNKIGIYWYATNGLTIAILQVLRAYTMYLLVVIVGRHLITAYALNKIMAHVDLPLILTPSRRNQALQVITGYAFSFATIGAIVGLNLGLQPVLSNPPLPEYYLFIALYLLLVPLGFFLPLWQTHKKLRTTKRNVLKRLRDKMQREYEVLIAQKEEATEQQMSHVKTLYDTIKIVEESAEWPFQINALFRLVSTVIFPFLFAILDWLFTLMDIGSGIFSS